MSKSAEQTAWLHAALRTASPECIVWPYATTEKGYGKVWADGCMWQTSHLVLHLTGSPRPAAPGNHALHSCDNPPCVNPAHLRWGTPGENNRESFARGRTNQGERHPMHRLTVDDVKMIRTRDYSAEGSRAAVAAEYGITEAHVGAILRRVRWAHVP